MKKTLSCVLAMLLCFMPLQLVSTKAAAENFTVGFYSQGSLYSLLQVNSGEKAAEPAAVSDDCLIFAGWYTDESFTRLYDFSQPVKENMSLYAGFYINLFNSPSTDFNAYISYTSHTLSSVREVSASQSADNRTAVCYVEPNTQYTVSVVMDTRFRGGFEQKLASSAVDGYFADEFDVNTSVSVGERRTISVCSPENAEILLLFYWTKGGALTFNEVRSSIEVYDSSMVVDGKNYAMQDASWQQLIISEQSQNGSSVGSDGCQWPCGLEIDKNDGKLLFFGTNAGGAFRSTDGGENFTPVNTGLYAHGASNFAIDPYNENHVLCLGISSGQNSSHGIYYSENMGDSWKKAITLKVNGDSYVEDGMDFDPSSYDESSGECKAAYFSTPYLNDGATGLTSDTAGMYKTEDGGRSWSRINDYLYDAIVRVASDGRVYASNSDGLFMSEDGGRSFTRKLDMSIGGLDITEISGVLKIYCNNTEGVFLSCDGGESFSMISGESYPCGAHSAGLIAVSAVNPDNMTVTYRYTDDNYYSHRVACSKDGGKTWYDYLVDHEEAIYSLRIGFDVRRQWVVWSPADENRAFTFGGDYLLTTYNAGSSWQWSSDGISDIMVGGMFSFNVYDPDIMYFGAQDYGGGITCDGGKTWKSVRTSREEGGIHVYGGYAASENVLYGGIANGWYAERKLMISFDGGKTITNTGISLDSSIRVGCESSYQSPTDPNVYFCYNMRSADGGKTWSSMTDSGCLQVITHGSVTKALYGVRKQSGYVMKSTDNGETWQHVNSSELPVGTDDFTHITDVAVDEKNGVAYAVVTRTKLFKISLDDGSISELTYGIPKDAFGGRMLRTVDIDVNNPEVVYVGGRADWYNSSASVMRSPDGGIHWETMTPNLSDSVAVGGESEGFETNCIRVQPVTGELWSGTLCYGFSKLTSPYAGLSAQRETVSVSFLCGVHKLWTQKVIKGKTVTMPLVPYAENGVFTGWYTDEECTALYDFSLPVSNEITLYAGKSEGVSAVFYANGEIFTQVLLPRNGILWEPSQPTLDGYIFMGWYTDDALSEKYEFGSSLTENTVLYAGFCKNEFISSTRDIAGYIRAADHILSSTLRAGGNYDLFSNRIALCRLDADTVYTVSLLMDTRFRGGLFQTYAALMEVPDYFILEDDKNNADSVGEVRFVTVTTGESSSWLALMYWAKGGAINCGTVRRSIKIYDASKLYLTDHPVTVCEHSYASAFGLDSASGHISYCANGCGSYTVSECSGGVPTCVSGGVCSVCSKIYLSPMEHLDADGDNICDRCGEKLSPSGKQPSDGKMSFLDRLKAFFMRIINFFKSLFA